MGGKWKQLRSAAEEAKGHGIRMQRKLMLYWVSIILVVFALLLLLLSISGVFSSSRRKLSELLANQEYNAYSRLSGQMDGLNAQGVALSETISSVLSGTLREHGAVFEDLNDNGALITEVEEALYAPLYSALRSSDCNGVFVLLNATVNTKLEHAENSRMGLYLRYAELDRTGSANQHLVCYRGVSEVARKQQVQLHNRWNLEFDTTILPGYEALMKTPVSRLADAGAWTGRVRMKDIWEDALLLYLPVLDWDGTVIGLCGAELSGLYFRLSYPCVDSEYGSMVTLIAPIEGDRLLMDRAMLGDTTGMRLAPRGVLTVKEGDYYNTYSSGGERYIGLHRLLNCTTVDGHTLAVVTLVPESGYRSITASQQLIWVTVSAVFLLAALAAALLLSRHFSQPIVKSLKLLQQEDTALTGHSSGISEIDELVEFLSRQPQTKFSPETLPPEIRELIDSFTQRASTLTGTERVVLGHYISGSAIRDIPELMCISASTAKVHNRNIYRKLGVNSYDELKAYIDILQRCGQVGVLLEPKAD